MMAGEGRWKSLIFPIIVIIIVLPSNTETKYLLLAYMLPWIVIGKTALEDTTIHIGKQIPEKLHIKCIQRNLMQGVSRAEINRPWSTYCSIFITAHDTIWI
jgi:hypothetical protein